VSASRTIRGPSQPPSGEAYRGILDSLQQGFCIIEMIFDQNQRPIDYLFLEANRSFESHTGLKNVVGKTVRDLVPGHEQHWFDIYGAVALKREPAHFQNPAAALGRWYDVSAFPFGGPEQRQVAVLFTDLSESMRVEEALRQSEQRFRSVFEHAAVGMARVGMNGEWLEVNQCLCSMTGYSREQLLLTKFQDITHPADLNSDVTLFARLKAGDIPTYNLEKRYIHKSGDVIFINLSVSLVRDQAGEPLYAVSVIEDITARKQSEAALRERDRQLAGAKARARQAHELAHEVNNPLEAITNLVYLLQHAPSAPDTSKHVETLSQQVDRVTALSRRILTNTINPEMD